MTPRRIEAFMWVLLFTGLALAIGFETDWGQRFVWPIERPETQAAPYAKPALTQPFGMPPADAFLEIAMRPLFIVTRRPTPSIPIEAAAKPSMKKDQFVLTGTTLVSEGKFAHLLEKTGNKSHVIQEGKEINGILVKEVHPTQVVLTEHDDTEVLLLRTAKAPPSTTSGQPSPSESSRANRKPPPPPSSPPAQ